MSGEVLAARGVAPGITACLMMSSPAACPAETAPDGVIPPRLMNASSEEFSGCYSQAARRAGVEGRVEMKITVGTDGRVSQHELPHGVEPWQKATAGCIVEKLRYEPAKRDGVPIPARVSFSLSLSIDGSDPLTLAKLAASEDELAAAIRSCYPAGGQEKATPEYRVTVNVRGWPSQVMLVKSTGDKKLDKAGACALKKLRFDPARRGDRPVMSTLLVPIELAPPSEN